MSTLAKLSGPDWDVRTAVYRYFVETTTAPATAELARVLNRSAGDVELSLRRLDAHHHLTLAPATAEVWMAHPFSATPTDFPVESVAGRYWANCAWDALGIPAVLARDTWTRTRCAERGVPIEFGVEDGRVQEDDAVVHFAVPARDWYANVAFT